MIVDEYPIHRSLKNDSLEDGDLIRLQALLRLLKQLKVVSMLNALLIELNYKVKSSVKTLEELNELSARSKNQ